MRMRFVPNAAGIEQVARGRQLGEFVGKLADRVLAEARRSAPVTTGDYRDSLASGPADLTVDGWEAQVGSSDPFWHLVEFGSVNNPPYRVLSNAVTAAGLEFEDDR